MKIEVLEPHPNGGLKHKIGYYNNGSKYSEIFYDENGKYHREGLPAAQLWYENGMICQKMYRYHGESHNINSLGNIYFFSNGKIWEKRYYLNSSWLSKLEWQNLIKNI